VLQLAALQLALAPLLSEQRLVGSRLRDVPHAHAGRIVSGGRVIARVPERTNEELLGRLLGTCGSTCRPNTCEVQQLAKRFRELAQIKERLEIVRETCEYSCIKDALDIDKCLGCGLSELICGNPDYCCAACRALSHEKAELLYPERLR